MRNFGNPHRADMQALRDSFAPAVGASLESFKFTDAFRDKIALFFFALFLSSVAIFVGVFTHLLFFWRA